MKNNNGGKMVGVQEVLERYGKMVYSSELELICEIAKSLSPVSIRDLEQITGGKLFNILGAVYAAGKIAGSRLEKQNRK